MTKMKNIKKINNINKQFMQGFKTCILYLYYFFKSLVITLITLFKSFYKFTDSFMKLIFGKSSVNRKKQLEIKKVLKICFYSILTIIAVTVIIIILRSAFFTVSVGSTAVVTKFGAFSRIVESGLNIRIPLIEKFYIVKSENIFELKFGFVNIELKKPRSEQEQKKDDLLAQHNREILKTESPSSSTLEWKGGLFQGYSQKQRLTHDYLRRKYLPKRTIKLEDMKKEIQKQKEFNKALKQDGVSLSGEFPLAKEMRLVTGDLNLILLRWTLQYTIGNPMKYLFNAVDTEKVLRQLSSSIMNEEVGNQLFKDIISNGRDLVEQKVLKRLQKKIDEYGLGLIITTLIIIDALPPRTIRSTYQEVNKAHQERELMIYNAERSYLNKIPKSAGEAELLLLNAKAYATKIIAKAKGETMRFTQINEIYEKYPTITEYRLYINYMGDILEKTPNLIVDSKIEGMFPIIMGFDKKEVKHTMGGQLHEMLPIMKAHANDKKLNLIKNQVGN